MNTKLLDFKIKRNLWADIFWAYKSAFHWNWLEFAEHKEYVVGDNIKFINWKASAKTGKLQVKKFEEERNLKVLFLIDNFDNTFPQKIQTLKETFYLLALSAYKNNDSISIFLPNQKIPTQPVTSLDIVFKTLENITQTGNKLEYQIRQLNKLNIQNYLIFILSDTDEIKNLKDWKLLALKNEINFINIFHSFENNLLDLDWIISLENKMIYDVYLKSEKIIQYSKLRKKKLDNLKKQLQNLQIDYVYLDEKLNPFVEIFKLFSKK